MTCAHAMTTCPQTFPDGRVCGALERVVTSRTAGFVAQEAVCAVGHSRHLVVLSQGPDVERPVAPRFRHEDVRARPPLRRAPSATARPGALRSGRTRRRPEAWVEQLRALWNAGVPAATIAARLGISSPRLVSGYASNYRQMGYQFAPRPTGGAARGRGL